MPLTRRQLLQGSATSASAGFIAATAALVGAPTNARPAQALRPPGALAEPDFLAACLRCGLCVRDCPPGSLKLADLGQGVGVGTPFFSARDKPCEMCEDLPCVRACPSGALAPALRDVTKAQMGVAVLVDHEHCLSALGLRCEVCVRVCPLVNQAISLDSFSNPRSDRHALFLPVVHAEACTGCGKCEQSCVLPEAAIKVLPARLARAEAATHWRKGWEAAERSDRPRFEAPVQRLPEGDRNADLVPLRSGREPYPQAAGGRP